MLKNNYSSVSYAKCVLSGEHTVLRGYPALVVPLKSHQLNLEFSEKDKLLNVEINSPYSESLLILFWETLRVALKLLNKSGYLDYEKGLIEIKNNIPMGAGLGFSAALCTAITKWIIFKGWLPADKLFSFARKLEDNFHGSSSGIDIVGSMSDFGAVFQNGKIIEELHPAWEPYLYLSYSNEIGITAECIKQVNQLHEDKPDRSKIIDDIMGDSVHLIEQSLHEITEHKFIHLLEGINLAYYCFQEWNLVTPAVQAHIDQLKSLGAIAAKPTGSGGGGYVLSLWNEPAPTKKIAFELIPVFREKSL